MELTMQSNGLGRFIESILPTGLTPFSSGIPGAFVQALTGNSFEGLLQSVVPSAINSVTKAGLTGQQIAQNEWTALREDTQYQRWVEDLDKAGINAAMLLGKSVSPSNSTPSAGDNGASVAGSFSNMLELAGLAAQIKNLHSQADLNEASAEEKRSNVALNEQWFDFNKELNPLKLEAQGLANDLSRDQRSKIKEETRKVIAEIDKVVAETETEATKQLYNMLAAELAQAEAWQIYELAPYKVALMEAQTQHERNMAALAAVETMYKKGLIDGGYIDAMCDEMKANARDAETRAAVDEFRNNIATGNAFSWNAETKAGKVLEQIVRGTIGLPLAAVDFLLSKINIGAFVGFSATPKSPGKSSLSLSNSELDKYGALR